MKIHKDLMYRPNRRFVMLFCSGIVAFGQAAMSQPLAQCVRDLVSAGVSPNVAAEKCVVGRASDPSNVDSRLDKYEKCMERNQYSILKGSPKTRGDGKTEYEYSIPVDIDYSNNRAMRVPDWVGRAGATCWVHGLFFPKVLCWDSEIKREKRSPESAERACRALIPVNSNSGKGTIIINQSSP